MQLNARQSGFDVLEYIRGRGNDVPLLILTARYAEDDRVQGLETGADDYLVKPVGAREILARVRAVLRRLDTTEARIADNGEIELDLASRELHYRGKGQILSAREFELMSVLLKTPGVILSRNQIERHVYGHCNSVDSNAVEVLIHGLRKKFDREVIRNVRGVGWMVAKGPQ